MTQCCSRAELANALQYFVYTFSVEGVFAFGTNEDDSPQAIFSVVGEGVQCPAGTRSVKTLSVVQTLPNVYAQYLSFVAAQWFQVLRQRVDFIRVLFSPSLRLLIPLA